MYPLSTVAAGLLLVFLDFRINEFDVLLDPLGWALAIAGLGRMSRSVSPEFKAPWRASIVAGLLSLTDVTGSAALALPAFIYEIFFVVTVWLLATAIMRRARTAGDADVARSFDRLRWVLVLTVLVGVVAIAAGASSGIVAVAVLLALVAYVWFLIKMYRSAKRPYLAIPDAAPSGGVGWL